VKLYPQTGTGAEPRHRPPRVPIKDRRGRQVHDPRSEPDPPRSVQPRQTMVRRRSLFTRRPWELSADSGSTPGTVMVTTPAPGLFKVGTSPDHRTKDLPPLQTTTSRRPFSPCQDGDQRRVGPTAPPGSVINLRAVVVGLACDPVWWVLWGLLLYAFLTDKALVETRPGDWSRRNAGAVAPVPIRVQRA